MQTSVVAPTATLVVPARFAGPPGAANGGWIAGHLASLLPDPTVEVTLRAMTPLERPLDLWAGDRAVTLRDGETLLASATGVDEVLTPPPFVNRATAEEATFRFEGFHDHPFPRCFVCGPDRPAGDGLRIFPGLALGRSGLVATTWTPAGAGTVGPELVWGALDCPTGWGHLVRGGVALLGRITARIEEPVVAGETYVVIGQPGTRSGRKLAGAGAVYTAGGRLVAVSRTTWIDVTPT